MRVLILNQTFHPDVAATGQLMWVWGHLARRKHRVTIVTSRNFYGTDQRHPLAFEKIDGIEIHRVGGTAFGKKTHLGRLADFASFYAAAAARLHRLSSPDVILALTSPPLVATLAMLHRQFVQTPDGRPVRFVYHLMDLYPDAAVASGVMRAGSLTDRALRRITGRTLETADAIIALGRDVKERLLSEYAGHTQRDRVHVIPPWADGTALRPGDKTTNLMAQRLGVADTFNVVYSGNLGVAHDLETMTAALDAMRNDPTMRWIFIGGGKRFDELQQQAKRSHWPHVKFLPFQDREALNESLNLADVHLISQHPAFTGIVVPSKLFGILAVGKPSIFVGPAEAEGARILCENSAGFVVPNGQPQLLISRLRELRQNDDLRRQMGARARNAFEQYYDRDIACRRIEDLLRDVTG